MNRFSWLLLALLLAGCGPKPQTHVLFISMDTTRADHLGAYGYATARTPTIDALAQRGFLFQRHLTPVPVTLPAHSSMFTGLTPPLHSARDNGSFVLPERVLTLAEVLKDSGYQTSAFIASFPLTRRFGVAQGFDFFDDSVEDETGRGKVPNSVFFDERPAAAVVDAAIEHHRQRADGAFFTFLHFFDPHQPQRPPAPYDLEFRDNPYDGEIAYVDEQIGRFLAFLEQRGELANTLIVLTADHGEGLGEHGESTHSTLLHQATLHVPLILAGPGVPQGETRSWTSSTQLFATVLDLLGIAQSEQAHPETGRSLLPLIAAGGVEPDQWPRFSAYFETIAPRAVQGASQLTAWMEGDERYVHGPRPELFNLDTDPNEQHNLHAEQAGRAQELFGELRGYLDAHESESVAESARRIDAATLDRLAGLGYIQFTPDALSSVDDLLAVDGLVDPKDAVFDVSLYSEARAALMQGDLQLALELYQALLARLPNNPKAHGDMALLYVSLGDPVTALHHLEQAQSANPGERAILQQRGRLLIEQGQWQEGRDLLLVDESKVDGVDCIWIARATLSLGDREGAEQWFRRCPDLIPDEPYARLVYANFLAGERRFSEAEPLYRQLLSDQPYYALGLYNYALLLIDAGQPDAASPLLRRAQMLAPQHEGTRRALAGLEATP